MDPNQQGWPPSSSSASLPQQGSFFSQPGGAPGYAPDPSLLALQVQQLQAQLLALQNQQQQHPSTQLPPMGTPSPFLAPTPPSQSQQQQHLLQQQQPHQQYNLGQGSGLSMNLLSNTSASFGSLPDSDTSFLAQYGNNPKVGEYAVPPSPFPSLGTPLPFGPTSIDPFPVFDPPPSSSSSLLSSAPGLLPPSSALDPSFMNSLGNNNSSSAFSLPAPSSNTSSSKKKAAAPKETPSPPARTPKPKKQAEKPAKPVKEPPSKKGAKAKKRHEEEEEDEEDEDDDQYGDEDERGAEDDYDEDDDEGDSDLGSNADVAFDPNTLSVEELREELKLRSLTSSGTKNALVKRLNDALAADASLPKYRLGGDRKRKRGANKKEPQREEYASEEDYMHAWHKWRETRDHNNESVKRSRDVARVKKMEHEKLCKEREDENQSLTSQVTQLRQEVAFLTRVLRQPAQITEAERGVIKEILALTEAETEYDE